MKDRITRFSAALLVAAFAWLALATPASAQFADQSTGLFTTTGSSNAYAATIPNVGSSSDMLGVKFTLIPNFSNDGAATLTTNSSIGPFSFRKPSASGLVALTGNELVAGQPAVVQFNGTFMVILSSINSTASTLFVQPGGYLTPCPFTGTAPTGCTLGNLVPTGDVTIGVGQTRTDAYYVPAFGNQIPIWNGSQFVTFQFAQLSLTPTSALLANTIYDAYAFSNAGVVTVCFGPAWTTSTAGSGARGSGAGTAQIGYVGGLPVNAVAISGCVNGANTYSVGANAGTLLASVLVSSSNGVLKFLPAYGQSRMWSIANVYNKQDLVLQAGDPTASWAYATGTWRPSNNDANNFVEVLSALPVDRYDVGFNQNQGINSGTNASTAVGVGWNRTNNQDGLVGQWIPVNASGYGSSVAKYVPQPAIGANKAQAVEFGGASGFFQGTITNMILTARWKG